MKLLILVDSLEYAQSNCYIHQLLATLEREVKDGKLVTLEQIRTDVIYGRVAGHATHILSLLKLRTLFREVKTIKTWLGKREIYCYDQDPWECFSDQATYPNSYQTIASQLNVKSFLNTSKWWSDHINSKGLPSKFVTMWMLPEYCLADPLWSARKVDVGFCGQLHPYRRELFESLQKEGISVRHFPSGDYQHYLNCLSQMKIFVHSEQVNWSVDGVKLSGPNALWIKDVEAAARGCVSMREYESECNVYGGADIPTIWPFDDLPGLVYDIKHLLTQDNEFNDYNVREAVDMIQTARGWRTVLDAMEIT